MITVPTWLLAASLTANVMLLIPFVVDVYRKARH